MIKKSVKAVILLVEDNPDDQMFTTQTLKNSEFVKELHVVEDGESAINFLQRQGEHEKSPRPDLIILDLNLPKQDGRQVLLQIKNCDDLKKIPVVVLTSSSAPGDIDDCYRLGSNCYLVKSFGLKEYRDTVHSIEDFWLNRVALPTREEGYYDA